MCRRNQLPGFCAVSLGIGVFIGCAMESTLVSLCAGIGLICCGVWMIRMK